MQTSIQQTFIEKLVDIRIIQNIGEHYTKHYLDK